MVIIILITIIIIVIIIIIIIITTTYMALRSRTEVEGRIQTPQTLSSPVSLWILRLRVAHHRTFFFSGLSRSLLGPIYWAVRSTLSSIRRRCCATVDGGDHV